MVFQRVSWKQSSDNSTPVYSIPTHGGIHGGIWKIKWSVSVLVKFLSKQHYEVCALVRWMLSSRTLPLSWQFWWLIDDLPLYLDTITNKHPQLINCTRVTNGKQFPYTSKKRAEELAVEVFVTWMWRISLSGSSPLLCIVSSPRVACPSSGDPYGVLYALAR